MDYGNGMEREWMIGFWIMRMYDMRDDMKDSRLGVFPLAVHVYST
jgi:hypothetical protein